ncbi:histone H1/H5 family protein, HCT subfamily [Dyadobacter sp. 32]|uniref:histone H1/H5 family protein, HCT subfamily n=1 Tax=Dyadobacter sp. 32 TaxID=538966 RepID=UPI0039C6D77D
MKSATKKLTAEIAGTISEKLNSISDGSKKIKKSIEKAAAKLARKVSKFEKENLKKKAKEAKHAEKKEKGKKGKEKAKKVASLVEAASKPTTAVPPVKTVTAKPAMKQAASVAKVVTKKTTVDKTTSEDIK